MQQMVHRLGILQAGGLNLLHRILAAHRAPEFCHETITLISHICDVPEDALKPRLMEELTIIDTVVETLEAAPVNMRLQLAGLRLLALWGQLGDKVQKKLTEAR